MIESSLKANVDGNVSENASIIGKEELVKELSKLVENEITKSKIKILEEYKQKPAIIQEKVDTTDPLLKLVNDAKETKICDCKGECKCGTTEEVCEKCEKTPCECNK